MKKLILILFVQLIGFQIHAQKLTQTVRGHIIDQDSKKPLVGKSV